MAGEFEQGFIAVREGDFKKAFKLWLPLAQSGNVDAQNNIGMMYDLGQGVTHDRKAAINWYRKAAEGGSADAQNQIGYAYFTGDGAELNLEEGVHWYLLAAQKGQPVAQANLGAAYGEGRGVKQSWELSTKYYRFAAEQGHPLAQSNLGVAYMNGYGVNKDPVEACMWLNLALQHTPTSDAYGRNVISANLDQLRKNMTYDQINSAQAKAKEWNQSHNNIVKYKPE